MFSLKSPKAALSWIPHSLAVFLLGSLYPISGFTQIECTALFRTPPKLSAEFDKKIKMVFSSKKGKLLNLVPFLNHTDKEMDRLAKDELSRHFSPAAIESMASFRKQVLAKPKAQRIDLLEHFEFEAQREWAVVKSQTQRLRKVELRSVSTMYELFEILQPFALSSQNLYLAKASLLQYSFLLQSSDQMSRAINIAFDIDPIMEDLLHSPLGKTNLFTRLDFAMILFRFGGEVFTFTPKGHDIENYKALVHYFKIDELATFRIDPKQFDYLGFAKAWIPVFSRYSNDTLEYIKLLRRPEYLESDTKMLIAALLEQKTITTAAAEYLREELLKP